jgi:hypothetical protein
VHLVEDCSLQGHGDRSDRSRFPGEDAVIWKGPKVTVVVDSPLAREALLEALRGGLLTKWERGAPWVRGVFGSVDAHSLAVQPNVGLAAFMVEFRGIVADAGGGSQLRGEVAESRGSRAIGFGWMGFVVLSAMFALLTVMGGLWYVGVPFAACMAGVFGGARWLSRRHVLKHKVPELMQYILERSQGTLVEGPSPNAPGES